MEKLYWALVVGVPQLQQGRVDAAILKNNSVFGDKMQIDEDGKKARTDYRIITKVFKQAAWLELRPQEGRTHQLRVHCAALGTPIQGDDKYSERKDFIQGEGISEQLHLHCRQMSIVHPKTNKNMTFVAPLPPHMVATWEFLGLELSEGS
jgi:23S rRNA pseudouridine955/2504/2580 synthase